METETIAPPTLTDWIDYRQLPPAAGGFSELFFDYVHDFPQVERFYRSDFRDMHSYSSIISAIDQNPVDRELLVRVLHDQNVAFGSSAKALENIGLLTKSNTYAVVTGQQVGLFGGPLYTIYKTITTIKLAEKLKAKHPALDFVPVFWLEGEDHDFAEMNNSSVLDRDNKVVKLEYLPGGQMPERNLGPIGELPFDDSLTQTFSTLEASLQKTEFTDALIARLKGCYAQGRTFNHAFTAWMNILFEDYGLVFISSNDARLKQRLAPLFIKEISEFPRTSQIVIERSAQLEDQYHAQIKAKSINLFLFHKGGRYLIEPREHDFSLKGTRHFMSREELLTIAEKTPDLLSPNVVLRPLAQDTLLPTVAYVAGPSEIAYHAQLQPVYEMFGVTQPVIHPRGSGSFIDERLQRSLEKYQLELVTLFDDIESVTTKVLEQIAEVKLDQIFGDTQTRIHDSLHELKFGLKEVDPTLLGTLEGVRAKIDTNLGMLKDKALAAQKRRNETAMRQIERAVAGLLPNGNLQEREVNVLYYMNKYGPDLVKWLTSELDISGFRHQVITL